MNSYQLWIRLTYWFREDPSIYLPTMMDIVAVIVLLFFIRRFREMRTPLVWMYVLVLLHALILPFALSSGQAGLLILFPFIMTSGPGIFICFFFCHKAASRIEKTEEDRMFLRVGTALLAFYLLLHIIFRPWRLLIPLTSHRDTY